MIRDITQRLKVYGILLLSILLTACTTPIKEPSDPQDGRDYVRWLPQQFRAPVPVTLERPKQDWWTEFESDELNRVVQIALQNNYDLRMAIARVAQSRSQSTIVRSAQFPTVDFSGGYSNQAPRSGIGYAPDTASWGSQPLWQAGLLVSYEVNLWGKQGFNTQAAYAQAVASEFDREVVTLSLISEVARAYFEVAALNERVDVSERNLAAIRKVSRGLERRLERGDSTLIDVSQQLILQKNTEAQVINLKLLRERAFNRLALLAGVPSMGLNIESRSVEKIKAPVVSPGLPSDLLCRRPDIRRAEATLEAAQADLYAARANLLPSFALSAQGGVGSFLLSTITAPQSFFYSLSTSLLQTVFDGGRKRAEIDVASARNLEILEAYANAVLSALRDVEDALAGVALTERRFQTLDQSRALARKLAQMSATVVEKGGMDFVQLFQIQGTVLSAEDAAVTARFNQLVASVDLFKAIGGGLILQEDPCFGGGKLPEPAPGWDATGQPAQSSAQGVN
jgi:NodT family efflux transporter outer membrane factor (OMF) lipoprotein